MDNTNDSAKNRMTAAVRRRAFTKQKPVKSDEDFETPEYQETAAQDGAEKKNCESSSMEPVDKSEEKTTQENVFKTPGVLRAIKKKRVITATNCKRGKPSGSGGNRRHLTRQFTETNGEESAAVKLDRLPMS